MGKIGGWLGWLFGLALVPVAVGAANYDYLCESDVEGPEGLCLAEPSDVQQPTVPAGKRKAGTIAETETRPVAKPDGRKGKVLFGATDDGARDPAPGLSTKAQGAAATEQAARAQDKIRQVEIFLQNAKGPQGGFGTPDADPIKAGQ